MKILMILTEKQVSEIIISCRPLATQELLEDITGKVKDTEWELESAKEHMDNPLAENRIVNAEDNLREIREIIEEAIRKYEEDNNEDEEEYD